MNKLNIFSKNEIIIDKDKLTEMYPNLMDNHRATLDELLRLRKSGHISTVNSKYGYVKFLKSKIEGVDCFRIIALQDSENGSYSRGDLGGYKSSKSKLSFDNSWVGYNASLVNSSIDGNTLITGNITIIASEIFNSNIEAKGRIMCSKINSGTSIKNSILCVNSKIGENVIINGDVFLSKVIIKDNTTLEGNINMTGYEAKDLDR